MLAALLCGEPHVAPSLARYGVAIVAERPGEIAPGEISWEPHSAHRQDIRPR